MSSSLTARSPYLSLSCGVPFFRDLLIVADDATGCGHETGGVVRLIRIIGEIGSVRLGKPRDFDVITAFAQKLYQIRVAIQQIRCVLGDVRRQLKRPASHPKRLLQIRHSRGRIILA